MEPPAPHKRPSNLSQKSRCLGPSSGPLLASCCGGRDVLKLLGLLGLLGLPQKPQSPLEPQNPRKVHVNRIKILLITCNSKQLLIILINSRVQGWGAERSLKEPGGASSLSHCRWPGAAKQGISQLLATCSAGFSREFLTNPRNSLGYYQDIADLNIFLCYRSNNRYLSKNFPTVLIKF